MDYKRFLTLIPLLLSVILLSGCSLSQEKPAEKDRSSDVASGTNDNNPYNPLTDEQKASIESNKVIKEELIRKYDGEDYSFQEYKYTSHIQDKIK